MNLRVTALLKMIAAIMVAPLVTMKHWMRIVDEKIETIRPVQVSKKCNVVVERLQNV
jgi:hypothetical protein